MFTSIPQNNETIGIEFECEFISSSLEINGWSNTHDASIETPMGFINNIKFLGNFNNFYYSSGVIGTEFVSRIIDTNSESYFKEINNFLLLLYKRGEPNNGIRSGLHFHISFSGPSHRTLKNLMRLAGHYESLFFQLGGMGRINRGVFNDFTYARPITLNGPPAVKSNKSWVNIFNLEDLIEPNKAPIENFWSKYGDLFNTGGDRYHPIRYCWINLYPLFPGSRQTRGTVEFRIFNKTFNPYFLVSAVEVCKTILRASVVFNYSTIKNFKTNSIYEEFDNYYLLDELKEIGLEESYYDVCKDILDSSDKFILKPDIFSSHLYAAGRSLPNFFTGEYRPPVLSKSPLEPHYVDIHTLGS